MILHNAKNGFLSVIYNEEYYPPIIRICTTPEGEIRHDKLDYEVSLSHDIISSKIAIDTGAEIYVITLDNIISDILEVEHENETLFSDH